MKSFDKALELGEKGPLVFYNRAELSLALGRWNEGCEALDDALARFAHADEPATGDTGEILRHLFTATREAVTLKTRIGTLIELYDRHQVLADLGQGLVQSIQALRSGTVNDTTVRLWRDVWQGLAGDRPEFKLPLRLLDAAARYREKPDRRILLELPVEERKVLEPLLEGDKKEPDRNAQS